jgi:hypothetical protein
LTYFFHWSAIIIYILKIKNIYKLYILIYMTQKFQIKINRLSTIAFILYANIYIFITYFHYMYYFNIIYMHIINIIIYLINIIMKIINMLQLFLLFCFFIIINYNIIIMINKLKLKKHCLYIYIARGIMFCY